MRTSGASLRYLETSENLTLNNLDVNEMVTEFPRKIWATLLVDGKPVKFQVDSGATCDVLRLSDLKEGKKIKSMKEVPP